MDIDLGRLAAWHEACAVDGLAQPQGDQAKIVAPALLPSRSVPPITLIVCAAQSEEPVLRPTLASLAAIELPRLQVIVAVADDRIGAVQRLLDDAGTPPGIELRGFPAETRAELQQAALRAAGGEFVGFLSPGDVLEPAGLALLAELLSQGDAIDIAYTDEGWRDGDGRAGQVRFKTGWDPDAQLGRDLLGRLCLLRRALVQSVGGLVADFAPAQEYDLNCRVAFAASPAAIRHLPIVACHRRIPGAPELDAARGQVAEYHAAARAVAGRAATQLAGCAVAVSPAPMIPWVNRVHWPLPSPEPLVSILIPTRDRADLLRNCTAGLQAHTAYSNFEVLILDNDSVEPETAALFAKLVEDPRFRIVPSPGPFNFSRINNQGVRQVRGEILLFLNNDIEVIDGQWLHELVTNAVRPDVGCVGARLLYGDQTVQHAGIVLKPGPLAMHVFRQRRDDHPGNDAQLAGLRSYLAVTGACLAIRRELFDRVGGFDEHSLAVSFQDVDLCLKVDARGYRNVCTPFAPLYHLEGASRSDPANSAKALRERRELDCMAKRWGDRFARDPYAHPRIALDWERGERVIGLATDVSLLDLAR